SNRYSTPNVASQMRVAFASMVSNTGCRSPGEAEMVCSKKFTEPPEQIKNEIAALKADKSVPEAEKKEGPAQLETALNSSTSTPFKDISALVLKCFDQQARCVQPQASNVRRAD